VLGYCIVLGSGLSGLLLLVVVLMVECGGSGWYIMTSLLDDMSEVPYTATR